MPSGRNLSRFSWGITKQSLLTLVAGGSICLTATLWSSPRGPWGCVARRERGGGGPPSTGEEPSGAGVGRADPTTLLLGAVGCRSTGGPFPFMYGSPEAGREMLFGSGAERIWGVGAVSVLKSPWDCKSLADGWGVPPLPKYFSMCKGLSQL